MRKLACNATNSGVIDEKGEVYVWGSGKYGLLGDPKERGVCSNPTKLLLQPEHTQAGKEEQAYYATTLSFGQYHAAVVCNDLTTNKDFVPLTYASDLFIHLKAYLEAYEDDPRALDHSLKGLFPSCQATYPYIPLSRFKEVMVNQVKLEFSHDEEYNRFFSDLAEEGRGGADEKYCVNLIELRDQMVGRRCGNGVVFTWGIANDGRLGYSIPQSQELIPMKPQIVRFPDQAVAIAKVSCGSTFTLALSSQGIVYSWGIGTSGGLGLGDVTQVDTPTRILYDKLRKPFDGIKDIACGANHCLALNIEDTTVYSWGGGQGGRLGHGDETGEQMPRKVAYFPEKHIKVILIEAGEATSAVITDQNEVLIWGVGLNGRLGTGKTSNSLLPTSIPDLGNQKVEDIVLGSNHCLCRLRSGKVVGWGSAKDGKLGIQSAQDRNFNIPREILALENEKVFQMAAGPFHSLVLNEDGVLLAFGSSKDGKLGFKDLSQNLQLPKKLQTSQTFFKVASLTNERDQKYPAFRAYDTLMSSLALPNTSASPTHFISASCGSSSSVLLLNDGTLVTFGSNSHGQLGTKHPKQTLSFDENQLIGDQDEESPDEEDGNQDNVMPQAVRQRLAEIRRRQEVELPQHIKIYQDGTKKQVRQVSAGGSHVLACTIDGLVFSWGRNDMGQLGLGRRDSEGTSKPTRIKALSDLKVVMAAAGETHSLFLTDIGDVYSCGFNQFGELGIGQLSTIIDPASQVPQNPQEEDQPRVTEFQQIIMDTKIELLPKHIQSLDFISQISAGKHHSLALSTDRAKGIELQVYTWGSGWHGQTGQGHWRNTVAPELVVINDTSSPPKFVMAACGAKHSIGLDTNGEIWYWGAKSSMGLPNTASDKQLVPIKLEVPEHLKLEKFVFVASGDEYSLAISQSNKVYCFGRCPGLSTQNPQSKDLQYFTLLDFTEKAGLLAAGPSHCLLLDAKGLPYSWGLMAHGCLGLFDSQNQNLTHNLSAMIKLPTTNTSVLSIAQQASKHKAFVVRPCPLPSLWRAFNDSMLEQFQSRRKKKLAGIDPREEVKAPGEVRYRFPLQKVFKQRDGLNEERVRKRDAELDSLYLRVRDECLQAQEEKNEQYLDSLYTAQNSLISRILTFPQSTKSGGVGGIDLLKDLKTHLPKAIIRNKHIFEGIFTLLQTHPCYMINWIQKTTLHRQPKEVLRVLLTVYGKRELRNDPRLLQQLMSVTLAQLKFELSMHDFREILWGRTESCFAQMFSLLFNSQDQNRHYVQAIIGSLLRKLQKLAQEMTQPGNQHQYVISESELPYILDVEGASDRMTQEMRQKVLREVVEAAKKKMVKKGVSEEVLVILLESRDMLMKAKEQVKDAVQKDEDINQYLAGLIHEEILNSLRSCDSFDTLQKYFWIPKVPHHTNPSPKLFVFNPQDQHLPLSLLCSALTNLPPSHIIPSVLLSATPPNMTLSYLTLSNSLTPHHPHTTSTLTLTTSDLISTYNSLLDHLPLIATENTHPPVADSSLSQSSQQEDDDPLSLLVSSLGGRRLETHRGTKELVAKETLEQRINLRVGMGKVSVGGRCRTCQAIFQYRECGEVVKRYSSKSLDHKVEVFRQLLETLPIIEENQSLEEVIHYEQRVEEAKKSSPDYEKLKVIDRFRKMKFDFMQRNKASFQADPDQEDEFMSRLQREKLEQDFLDSLYSKLALQHRELSDHQAYQDAYFSLFKTVEDKLFSQYSNAVQKTCDELKIIAKNAESGAGSAFVKDFPALLAGRLHEKISVKRDGDESVKKRDLGGSDKLQEFYAQVNTAPMPQVWTKKQRVGSSFFGKYPLYLMRQKNVLVKVELDGKKMESIMKQTSFIFYDDGDQGFRVEVMYEETEAKYILKCLGVFGTSSHEAILETFTIDKHLLAELRRTFSIKSVVTFGSSQFNLFELVLLLNEIQSKIYLYQKPAPKKPRGADNTI